MIIYMAHPFGGDPENLQRARRWYCWIYRTFDEVVPVADWILTIEVLDDANADDRAKGMAANFELIARCDQIWSVGAGASLGRAAEVSFALHDVRIPHLDLSHLVEPPTTSITLPALQWPKQERVCEYRPPKRRR